MLKWLWLWDPMVGASWVPQILLVVYLRSHSYLHLPYRLSFCSSHTYHRESQIWWRTYLRHPSPGCFIGSMSASMQMWHYSIWIPWCLNWPLNIWCHSVWFWVVTVYIGWSLRFIVACRHLEVLYGCWSLSAVLRRWSSSCGYGIWRLEPVCSYWELLLNTINNRCAIFNVERWQEQLLVDAFLKLLISGSCQKKILEWLWLWDMVVGASLLPFGVAKSTINNRCAICEWQNSIVERW